MPGQVDYQQPSGYTADADATTKLQGAGLMVIVNALGKLANVPEVSHDILTTIGLDSGNVLLLDCIQPQHKATVRLRICESLFRADRSLRKEFYPAYVPARGAWDAAKPQAIANMTRKLVKLEGLLREHATTKGMDGQREGPAKYIQIKNEEEVQYQDTTFGQSELELAKKLLGSMYNINLKQFWLPKMNVLRKVAHFVVQQLCWPDPARVPLKDFKVDENDSMLLCIQRLVYSVMCCAAGMAVPDGVRDDGAGKVRKYADQFASANVLRELPAELEQYRDKMSNTSFGSVGLVLHTSLYNASTMGEPKMSISLAAQQQVPKLVEHVAAQGGLEDKPRAPAPPTPNKAPTPRSPKTPTPNRKRPKQPLTAFGVELPKQYVDAEGELGPNGLPRKKGGNPDSGKVCDRFAKSGVCKFNTCSFKHAK